MVALAMQTIAGVRPAAMLAARPSKAPRRAMRMVVRAEQQGKGDLESDSAPIAPPQEVNPAPPPATQNPVNPIQPSRNPGFGEVFSFSGVAPEIVNGRLAMLGFLAAVGAELASGQPVSTQFQIAPISIIAGFLVFITASLVPIFKGVKNNEAFGPFTPQAELINGRAAMLGFASLLITEAIKGSALF